MDVGASDDQEESAEFNDQKVYAATASRRAEERKVTRQPQPRQFEVNEAGSFTEAFSSEEGSIGDDKDVGINKSVLKREASSPCRQKGRRPTSPGSRFASRLPVVQTMFKRVGYSKTNVELSPCALASPGGNMLGISEPIAQEDKPYSQDTASEMLEFPTKNCNNEQHSHFFNV